MTRALSASWTLLLAVVIVGMVAMTGRAEAQPKPTVAVLGLEVVDPSGNIDQPSTLVAKDLTDGLRSRAKVGSGPYTLQPGSDKELIDEKLIKNCDNEAIPCMSQIGKDLGADFLIYGRLEKKPDGYSVTINLLNVSKKKIEKAKANLTIPFNQKDPQSITAAARKVYNDLTGVSESGTLVVRANADRGTVLLDDAPKGNLASGAATIGPLPEGRYRLSVEADGFKRSTEVVVTVRAGETTTQAVTLEAGAGDIKHEYTGTTSGGGGGRGLWKGAFGVSVAAGLASGAVWIYGWKKIPSDSALTTAKLMDEKYKDYTEADCGKIGSADPKDLQNACSGNKLTKFGVIGVSISGLAIAFTGYMAFGRSGGEARPVGATGTTSRRSKKKRELSITPIVSADGGGATFQLDW